MISFVIPAHNEERLIGRTLGALHTAARAVGEPYEIIVVDDASTDATAALAASQGARVVPVQYRHIAAARNAGAQHARGDVLIFVDADTRVTDTVVRAAMTALGDGAIGGGARARFDGRIPLYGRALMQLWLWLQPLARYASGCFLFCTRRAFDAAGRFDETIYAAEDVAISRRLKRVGRFVILRESVITSGRNLRAHSGFDALRMLAAWVLHGPPFLKSRRGLGWWYGGRRDDPDST